VAHRATGTVKALRLQRCPHEVPENLAQRRRHVACGKNVGEEMSRQEARRPSDRVYAVERALMLLQCYSRAGERRTLAALARRSGLYKSTALRLAGSLCRMGFLIRDPAGSYSLGPELRRLASLTARDGENAALSQDATIVLRPVVKTLAASTLETASFYVREGQRRFCLVRQNSPRPVRHHVEEGGLAPLTVGAGGAVIRAFSKHARDPRLKDVRARGWALSLGEKDPDLAAVSVPVFNRDKELLGALTISAVRTRFPVEKQQAAREALLSAARAVSKKLANFRPDDLLPAGRQTRP
jgi:DNA-binding IclR family transcriptional regulator